jgi:hypothetical protein
MPRDVPVTGEAAAAKHEAAKSTAKMKTRLFNTPSPLKGCLRGK